MSSEPEQLRREISSHHRRVISVRLQQLEEYCRRLLDLFRAVDSTMTSHRALPEEKTEEVRRRVQELQSKISQINADLALERVQRDAAREAAALVAAMTVNVEELHPQYLKGYGKVPKKLGEYLETGITELLRLTAEIDRALGRTVTQVKPER